MPKVTMIPATINPLTHLPSVAARKRRVAGYARVSTDSDEQFTSYEAQVLLDGGRVDRIEAKKKPKGLAPKTVRNIHQMIGSAYNLAMEQKLVSKNPTQGCALPKVEHKEMKTLTADQLGAFFWEARDSGVYELYYLDLATGLRRGELLGLKWTDVDFEYGAVRVQQAISRQNGKVVEAPLKTKNAYRTLPLSADAIDVLKMQKCKIGNSEWGFT